MWQWQESEGGGCVLVICSSKKTFTFFKMEQTLGECRRCMSFLEGEYMRYRYGGW